MLKIRAADAKLLPQLQTTLTPFRGGNCHVAVQYYGSQARGTFSFGADWKVRPAPALLEELEKLLGRGSIAVLYSPPPQAADAGYG